MTALKPRLLLNTHKHAPYIWRCTAGKHNGYGDTLAKAFASFTRNVRRCNAHHITRQERQGFNDWRNP